MSVRRGASLLLTLLPLIAAATLDGKEALGCAYGTSASEADMLCPSVNDLDKDDVAVAGSVLHLLQTRVDALKTRGSMERQSHRSEDASSKTKEAGLRVPVVEQTLAPVEGDRILSSSAPDEEDTAVDDLWPDYVKDKVQEIHAGNTTKQGRTHKPHVSDSVMWSAFAAFVVIGALLEVFVLKSFEMDMSISYSSKILAFWLAIGAAFCGFLYAVAGTEEVYLWLDGYVLEIMLSIDNLFLFVMLFSSFRAPPPARSKLLMIGVTGAFVLRLVMFSTIAVLTHLSSWMIKILGLFIIYTAYKTVMFDDDEEEDFENNIVVKTLKQCVPLTGEIDSAGSLFIGGKGTPMLLCAATLLLLDCVFAVDSVTAKSALCDDLYLNMTSTGIALFSLRALYYILQAMADMFAYLKYGIGLILLVIGLKIVFPSLVSISDGAYLCCLMAILIFCIGLSIAFPPKEEENDASSTEIKEKLSRK